jgi:STD1/MTH1
MLLSVSYDKTSYDHIEVVERNREKTLQSPRPFQQKRASPLVLPLSKVVPTDFSDMYGFDVLCDPKCLSALGRPLFTQRDLIDWNLNDLRSLLIVDSLKPQWGNQLPLIAEKGYRLVYLPLDAGDEEIIETLISSDIYKEHNFDEKFLRQTARYTVEAARQRAASRSPPSSRSSSSTSLSSSYSSPSSPVFSLDSHGRLPLTKPEWRNIIENYLLNLGCEAQCRMDYKKACVILKKQKQQQLDTNHHSSTSLLKKALLTSSSTSPDFPSYLKPQLSSKHSLTRSEKQTVWVAVQKKLYERLGLDWEADDFF